MPRTTTNDRELTGTRTRKPVWVSRCHCPALLPTPTHTNASRFDEAGRRNSLFEVGLPTSHLVIEGLVFLPVLVQVGLILLHQGRQVCQRHKPALKNQSRRRQVKTAPRNRTPPPPRRFTAPGAYLTHETLFLLELTNHLDVLGGGRKEGVQISAQSTGEVLQGGRGVTLQEIFQPFGHVQS